MRGLCREAKIKEGELLTHLAANGTTDGSIGTLEELMLSETGKTILQAVADSWPDLVARMGEAKGGNK